MSPIYRATSVLTIQMHPATFQQPLGPNTFADKLYDSQKEKKKGKDKKIINFPEQKAPEPSPFTYFRVYTIIANKVERWIA